MDIRKITGSEKRDAAKLFSMAFHTTIDDMEKYLADNADCRSDDYGAFTDDGKLMSRIMDTPFETYYNGHIIKTGGIGAVSTFPEYRGTGSIRELFKVILSENYHNGVLLSALFPFSHEFYRKFGYETVCIKNVYEFSPSVLSSRRFDGTAVLWTEGDGAADYCAVYDAFASKLSLMAKRDESYYDDLLTAAPEKNGTYCYMLCTDRPVCYIIYTCASGHEPEMRIKDLAWNGKEGFDALLGFLARFTADFDRIYLPLPAGLEFLMLADRPYDIKKTTSCGFMVRVTNAPGILKLTDAPAQYTIKVEDALIPENCGTWLVSGHDAVRTDRAPDITVSERALAQLIIDGLDIVSYRRDVTINANEDTLRKVFTRRQVFTEESF